MQDFGDDLDPHLDSKLDFRIQRHCVIGRKSLLSKLEKSYCRIGLKAWNV